MSPGLPSTVAPLLRLGGYIRTCLVVPVTVVTQFEDHTDWSDQCVTWDWLSLRKCVSHITLMHTQCANLVRSGHTSLMCDTLYLTWSHLVSRVHVCHMLTRITVSERHGDCIHEPSLRAFDTSPLGCQVLYHLTIWLATRTFMAPVRW